MKYGGKCFRQSPQLEQKVRGVELLAESGQTEVGGEEGREACRALIMEAVILGTLD